MSKNKLFVSAVCAVLTVYGLLGFYTLPSAHFEGDLTRLAPFPETLFGWTKKQPEIAASLLQQSPLNRADVLVIGDSFSAHGVWQSVVQQSGLRVHTEEWGSMPFICGDIEAQIRHAGFNGKWVIIETVERNLMHRINDSRQCAAGRYLQSSDKLSNPEPPPALVARDKLDYSGKISVGFNATINALLFSHIKENLNRLTYLFNQQVVVRPVVNGCQLFSHPACTHALFYSEESGSDNWQAAVDGIVELNHRLSGFTPVWVVVPNKTTSYFYPSKRLWAEIQSRNLGPDMLRVNTSAIESRLVDLYPGNNTHVSTEGYLLMGRAITKELR